MGSDGLPQVDLTKLPSPCYIVDEVLLEKNLQILADIQKRTGCKILLALKGFAMFSTFPLVKKYLNGICASSFNEARLGKEEFGKEVHVFAPAYTDEEFPQLLKISDHIVFNSFAQLNKFKPLIKKSNVEIGLRLNPEYSEIKVDLYNPSGKFSRLGITLDNLKGQDISGVSGLHFHTLCEQNSDTLERVLAVFEKKFEPWIRKVKWVNFGGGHHITRPDYNIDKLCSLIIKFKEKYKVDVYLEPGEAIALNTGFLIATVMDIVHNGMDIAILDTSAEAHMPDVLAMPYKPKIIGAENEKIYDYTYRLGGLTCLAGDIIGDYSFKKPLQVGDKLIFTDMAHYSMVKNTTFNGIPLPSIIIFNSKTGKIRIVKKFGYEDYRNRLS